MITYDRIYKMKKLLGIVVLGLLLSGCETTNYTPPNIYDIAKYRIAKNTYEQSLAKINSARLILLESGMSKSQVLDIMGTTRSKCHNNPLSITMFNSEKNNINIIYYYTYTDTSMNFTCSHRGIYKANYTPLVLLNGKLIGWGHESLKRVSEQYDIKIKKDLNIKVE